MKTLLAGVSIALLAGTVAVQADAQYVKLVINNKANISIQVDVFDRATNKRVSTPEATPGGTAVSQAMLKDDGTVDFMLSILYRDSANGSYYHCLDVSTNPNGQSELSYDLTTDSGQKCSG